MLHQSVVYPPDDAYPFHITAKRYWLAGLEAHACAPDALTLIALHSTSFHKETWEPTLSHLLSYGAVSTSPVRLREVWAIDCPNHGAAGILNEVALLHETFSCQKYAEAVHRFLLGGHAHGAQIDFRERTLVGIGHSLGGNAMVLLQRLEPRLTFRGLVIAEPMLSPTGPDALRNLRASLIQSAQRRHDTWKDKATALQSLKARGRTARWNPGVLELFVAHAIRQDLGSQTVTLACTRQQEISMYLDNDGATAPLAELHNLCKVVPVHLILGAQHDFIPKESQDGLIDPSFGRRYASVTMIEGTGHLEVPDKLALEIFKTLLADDERQMSSKM